MQTEAQKRAAAKYTKEKVKAFNLRFYPADADIWEWLQAQEGKNEYVRSLIRADMEARKG